MLAAPGEGADRDGRRRRRPMFAAADITPFYLEHGPRIFPQRWSTLAAKIAAARGPKYDGRYLRGVVRRMLGETTVGDTLTNVVVPTFDVRLLQPVIFSTYEAKNSPLKNALLSDVCIGTSSAPTYLPAHCFRTHDGASGETREYNLIDGGVAANNPVQKQFDSTRFTVHIQPDACMVLIGEIVLQTMVAMTMITEEIMAKEKAAALYLLKPPPEEEEEHGRFLVLSIGTGLTSDEGLYTAEKCSRWGALSWLRHGGMAPIIDIFMAASSDLVDIHVAVKFQLLHSERNYLRVQANSLRGAAAAVDAATPENMGSLVGVGERLLAQRVSRVNVETGRYEEVPGEGSNADALARIAGNLSEERTARIKRRNTVQAGVTGF
ncbi:hypothetical protein OsJ_36440 [Oryza sativa Japonica Group]|uniref:Patatin n=1 Tax=Oryza sativa subsp. japonica TaxID=39947 RepID=A3CIA2_ORYSJ|nr:hypothetical protein OsJ_36440 [Oryza sativa Japonica Group]